jgi:hypothetical protein
MTYPEVAAVAAAVGLFGYWLGFLEGFAARPRSRD